MTRRAILLPLAASWVALGCGSSATPSSTPPDASSGTSEPAPAQRTLEAGRSFCREYGLKGLAVEYHTRADPIAVADAYAKDFTADERQFAVQGCLEGLGHY
jgi:hypothetical protein